VPVPAITVRFNGDASGLERATDQAASKMSKLKDGINKAAIGIAGGLAVAAPAMVGLSREITLLDNKAKTVFAEALPGVEAWAEANKAAMGLSARETTALAVNLADLLKPMGFTSQQAAEQSQKMLDLAGALSSWSGGTKSAAEVSDIMTAALLGETDGLKALGISISASDVQARLAAQGQDKLTGAALQQATALATQQLILEKSTDAQDAWKNGAKAAAEQQNNATVKVKEAREALAVALTPAIQAGTAALSTFADWTKNNEGKVKALGIVVASLAGLVLAVAAAMKIATAAQKVWVAMQAVARVATIALRNAQLLLNLAYLLNPIGLVVIAIGALVAAFVIAYKKSETFRNIVQAVMRTLRNAVITGVQFIVDKFLWFAESIVGAGAKAFGWVPGLGGKLKKAHAAIQQFRDDTNATLEGLKDHEIKVRVTTSGQERLESGGATLGSKNGLRAAGGPVFPRNTYLVGERGPELLTLGARGGYVTPNHRLGGGPTTVEIHATGPTLRDIVRVEIREHDRDVATRARTGAYRRAA
jgi:hypothetical protein